MSKHVERDAHGKMRYPMTRLALILLLGFLVTLPGTANAAGKSTNREIYLYQGADRDRRLVETAKKEGKLVLYSTLTVKDSNSLIGAFEKKYGIKVTFWRAGQDKIVQRVLTEARAGRHEVDVLETDGAHMEILYREKILEEFYSPGFK